MFIRQSVYFDCPEMTAPNPTLPARSTAPDRRDPSNGERREQIGKKGKHHLVNKLCYRWLLFWVHY